MAYNKKSWQEKLHTGAAVKVVRCDKKFADIPEGATLVVTTPEVVDAYIRNIPEGSFTPLSQMRADLAATYHADYCCPITAGIFLRIAAEAAFEAHGGGKPIEDITPFWRMVDPSSPAAKKLSFGTEFITLMQAKEHLKVKVQSKR